MTLTEFLLARIAEDEAVARECKSQISWWVDGPAMNSGKYWVYETGENFRQREMAEHIARWDPARVLVECEVKRQVMALAAGECSSVLEEEFLKSLALSYADHPDYDPDWRIS